MLVLGIAVVIWGFSFSLAKISLLTFDPFELVTLRLLLGSIAGLFLSIGITKWAPSVANSAQVNISRGGFFSKDQWRQALVIGVFEFAGTYLLYTWSLKFLPSGVIGTLTLMTPVLTYIVGTVAGIDKLRLKAGFALALSLIGGALCLPLAAIFNNFHLENQALWGTGLILASNLCFAIGNVAITHLEMRRKWNNALTFHGQFIGFILAGTVLVFNEGFPKLEMSKFKIQNWILPLYLGLVATGLGFFLWNWGVQKVSATKATLVGNLKGPISVLIGCVLLQEHVSLELFVGLVLLFISIIILPREKRLQCSN